MATSASYSAMTSESQVPNGRGKPIFLKNNDISERNGENGEGRRASAKHASPDSSRLSVFNPLFSTF